MNKKWLLKNAEIYTDQNTGDKKLMLTYEPHAKIWLDLLIDDDVANIARKLRGLADEIEKAENGN